MQAISTNSIGVRKPAGLNFSGVKEVRAMKSVLQSNAPELSKNKLDEGGIIKLINDSLAKNSMALKFIGELKLHGLQNPKGRTEGLLFVVKSPERTHVKYKDNYGDTLDFSSATGKVQERSRLELGH